jgi:hypothetical protein
MTAVRVAGQSSARECPRTPKYRGGGGNHHWTSRGGNHHWTSRGGNHHWEISFSVVETATGLGVETTTGILFFQPLESMPQSRSLNSGAYCAAGVRNHEHL